MPTIASLKKHILHVLHSVLLCVIHKSKITKKLTILIYLVNFYLQESLCVIWSCIKRADLSLWN